MEADTTQRNGPRLEEPQLIAAVLAGDTQLFHELIRPHERSVFAMAMSLLKDEADAEDAMQETFLKAFHNLASFRGDAKFSTWLISIVLNEARSKLRRKKLVSLDVEPDDDTPGSFSPALLRDWREVPSEALQRQELRLLLQESIAALPDGYRVVFLLREVEELSTHEAAAMLQMTESALKVRLHRARMMLQKDLAPKLKHFNRPATSDTKRRWFPWS
jgi:RNA polymerase sigma-70 factor (ECF subfamily)